MSDVSANTLSFSTLSLLQGLRLDGRTLLEPRPLTLLFDTQQTSSSNKKEDPTGVIASLGQTRTFTKLTSRIVEPRKARPQEGFLQFKINL